MLTVRILVEITKMLERFLVPEKDRVYIKPENISRATTQIFRKMGLSQKDSELSTEVLMTSDMRGCETHGVSNMLRTYVKQYGAGELNAVPKLTLTRETTVTANVDGDAGLGLHVLPKAMEIAMDKADKHGTGTVVVHNSRHIGMLAYHAMMPLSKDMIGLCITAGNPMSMVPTFAAQARFSTNPWAYAVPAGQMADFVFDIATTQVAGNKLALATRVNAPMEPAWITKSDGSPIMTEVDLPDNPDSYMMLPMGGTREQGSHKGYGFAAVAEVLCDLLSGMPAGFLMPRSPRGIMGHFVQAIKIDAFTDVSEFKTNMDDMLRGLIETPTAPGHERVIYPGLPESEEIEKRQKEGIPYHKEVIQWFESIRNELELDYNLFE